MGPNQTGLEMMGQHHPHVLQQHNPAHHKAPEDFQNQEAQNMGGMEQQAGVESLQFDYAGNHAVLEAVGALLAVVVVQQLVKALLDKFVRPGEHEEELGKRIDD